MCYFIIWRKPKLYEALTFFIVDMNYLYKQIIVPLINRKENRHSNKELETEEYHNNFLYQ
jgi:hypothetical protein